MPAVGPSNRSPPLPNVPGLIGPANLVKSRSEWQSTQIATCSARYLPRSITSGDVGSVSGPGRRHVRIAGKQIGQAATGNNEDQDNKDGEGFQE